MPPRSRPLASRLALAGLVVLVIGCAGASAPEDASARRVLVVGWDGASYRVIDRLVAQGRLPHLAALLERGASATLESTAVPVSSAAWTSAFSGKDPGETGVYGFFEPVPGTYDVRLVDARTSLAPPVWRLLSARGRRSIVFGVPLTYPPEPILGTLVAGMLSPANADYAWPPGFADELRARGFVPDLETWADVREVDEATLDRQLAIKRDVVLDLLGDDAWSLAVVVFKSLDVFSHRAYETDFDAFVAPVYERLDAILGDLVARVGPDVDVLVVSDHGFRAYPGGLNLHAWLVREGWVALQEPERVVAIDEGETLARRVRSALLALRRATDWPRTQAFVHVTEGNFGALRLNLAGREPYGRVAPEEAAAVLAELERELLALEDGSGRRLVRRVLRTDELYPGPARERLPDLIFEAAEDVQVFAEEGGTRVSGPYSHPVPDHDRDGILVAAGPSIAAAAPAAGRVRFAIEDLAPTLLHLLGEPVTEEMTGDVLGELLRTPGPVKRVPEAEVAPHAPRPLSEPFTDAELEELRARLTALGYGD